MSITPIELRTNTVQEIPDAKKDGYGVSFWEYSARGPLLPPYGTRAREKALRNFYRRERNWSIQGAFSGITKQTASLHLKIIPPDDLNDSRKSFYLSAIKDLGIAPTGDRPDVEYWEAIIKNSDFGNGFGSFVQKGVDYFRQDGGWWWELIAPGDPMKAPTGPIQGIAHLDSLRCIPTGDFEYPVVYASRKTGELHLMHYSRVVHLVDMPDGDEMHPGYGLCALSRAVSIANRQINVSQYVDAQTDDKPAPGIVKTNINQATLEKVRAAYRMNNQADDSPVWGKQLWFFGPDPQFQLQIETMAFSQAPDKFDYQAYTDVDMNALALAIGVDIQELWQLTGGNLGSGQQSEILHQKSRGKTIGMFLSDIERGITSFLPEGYSAEFQTRDDYEETQRATNAQMWVGTVNTADKYLSEEDARQILVNNIEPFREVLTDDNGQLLPLDKEPEPMPPQLMVGAPVDNLENDDSDVQPDDDEQMAKSLGGWDDVGMGSKAIQSTLIDFETEWADFTRELRNDQYEPGVAKLIGRALVNRFGRAAFIDGLNDGGVSTNAIEGDDRDVYMAWFAEQSGYVNDYIDNQNYTVGTPDQKAKQWGNKTLISSYQEGIYSANRNGMYEWVLGKTEQHCKDCLRLNGQRHRFKSFKARGLLPKSSQLACHGDFCDCRLVKTNEKARGRF